MSSEFLISNERQKLCTSKHVSIVTSEYSFEYTFLIVWWGLVRVVTVTNSGVCSLCYNYLHFHELLAGNSLQRITTVQSDI
jgi:hypothetical protein